MASIAAVHRVDQSNQTVRTLAEVTPHGADLVSAFDAPHGEIQVLALNGNRAEAARSEVRDDIANLYLIEDRGHTTYVKPYHHR